MGDSFYYFCKEFFFFFGMWTIFKVFVDFVTVLFLFYVLVFPPQACAILAPQLGVKPAASALEGEVLTTGPPRKSLEAHFRIKETRGLKVKDWKRWVMQIARDRKQERLLHRADVRSRAGSRDREASVPSCFLAFHLPLSLSPVGFAGCGAGLSATAPTAAVGPLARGAALPRGSSLLGLEPGQLHRRETRLRCTTREARAFGFLTPFCLLYLIVDVPTVGAICVPAGTPHLFYSLDYTHAHRSFSFSKSFLFGCGSSRASWFFLTYPVILQALPSPLDNHMFKVHLTVFLLYPWNQQLLSHSL